MASTEDERASREHDVAAFMALPRSWLYLGAASVLALFLGLAAAAAWSVAYLGLWLPPLVSGLCTTIIAVLRLRPAGRGALWVLVGNDYGPRAPRHSFWVGVVLTLILAAIPAGLMLLAAI